MVVAKRYESWNACQLLEGELFVAFLLIRACAGMPWSHLRAMPVTNRRFAIVAFYSYHRHTPALASLAVALSLHAERKV